MPSPTTADNELTRFYEKTERVDGCLVWTGATDGQSGYGRVWIPRLGPGRGRTVDAHRWIWTKINGPVPEGLEVRHSCDNPPCVDLEHLLLGTTADNMHDRDSRGRHGNTQKTECPRGHPYNEANTRFTSQGWRACRVCDRERKGSN